MTRNLIEFHAPDPRRYPAPYPASRGVPEWLKEMPAEVPLVRKEPAGGGGHSPAPESPQPPAQPRPQPPAPLATLKQCPPFIEAMTCGYLIPLAGDVTLTLDTSGALKFSAEGKIIDTQHPLQLRGTPFEGRPVAKFMNPWVVKTPPGYSTLFIPPMNNFVMPFQVLSGVVETDTYYRPVNFPSLCLMRPGSSVTLKRGTPIVQVIPFQREAWQSQVAEWDREAMLRVERELAEDVSFYKAKHWQKKTYG